MPGERIDRPGDSTALAWGFAGVIGVAAIWAFHDLRFDDAYITFRYGQNLARGMGLTFNPHQRVMGSTSPGEVLLSAVVYRMGGLDATPAVMSAIGCAGWTAQALILFFMLEGPLGRLRAGTVAAAIAFGAAGSAQWVALETNVVAAFSMGAVLLAMRSRWIGAACAVGIAGLFRPDAYLLCAPLAVMCLLDDRRRAWRPALALLLVSLPWPLFATWYFGSPIPRSALAKYHAVSSGVYALHILTEVPCQVLGFGSVALKAVAFWTAAIPGAWLLVRAQRKLMVLLIYGALHALAYVVLAPDPVFRWHLYPLTLIAVSCALVFLSTLASRLPRMAVPLGAVAIVALVCVRTGAFALSHATDDWFGSRDLAYKKVAALLSTCAMPQDIVDAEEVGTLAYYTDLRMNDHTGLVTPYPGDVFWRLAHGRDTKLRWLVLNSAQINLGLERPYFEARPAAIVRQSGWTLYVVDVKAPRTDGIKAAWD